MKIISFTQWDGDWDGKLPPIILNPEFVDLWNDEYKGYLDLWYFLEAITDEDYTNHYEIIRQLENRGIHTESVGGGVISNELYAYIDSNGVDNPINEYLKTHFPSKSSEAWPNQFPKQLIVGKRNNKLYWKGWHFPNSMFVFTESMNNSFSINWPSRNPMEVKE